MIDTKELKLLIGYLLQQAKELEGIGDKEGLRGFSKYYGKAEGYREIAELLKREFVL